MIEKAIKNLFKKTKKKQHVSKKSTKKKKCS